MTKGNPEFHSILRELGDLHDLKNKDYANTEAGDPLFNLKEVTRLGMPTSTGTLYKPHIWVRID